MHEDDAEQDRVDAVAGEHRIEQRHGDDDHAEALDQAAEHREEHEQRQIEFELAKLQADDELGDLLADAREADARGEDVGGEDQEQDVAAEMIVLWIAWIKLLAASARPWSRRAGSTGRSRPPPPRSW